MNDLNPSPTIIHEDDYLLVITKPAGVVVNSAKSVKHKTIQDWLRSRYQIFQKTPSELDTITQKIHHQKSTNPNPDWDQVNQNLFYLRCGIVHRLDKETSGIIVIAKQPESYLKLLKQFHDRLVKKQYLALAHGQVDPPNGIINQPVGRLPWNREKFGVLPEGRRAVTKFQVLKTLQMTSELITKHHLPSNLINQSYSLVKLSPQTGRTHQIRVHLKYLNHPIVSDLQYAGRKTARQDRRWCPRLFLHAQTIKFEHPHTPKKVEFESELTSDLQTVLQNLKNSST